MKPRIRRQPTGYASSSKKTQKKWEEIVSAFMCGDFERLRAIQRTGTRGRIFTLLINQCFDVLGITYKREPIFSHVSVSTWYEKFAEQHGLKLRVNDFYNPDFLFRDGSWVEITLSENTAFKKLFRYAHQASYLLVIWLDSDVGLHKTVCEGLLFPNAIVRSVEWYYPQLERKAKGPDIIKKLEILKELKHEIL